MQMLVPILHGLVAAMTTLYTRFTPRVGALLSWASGPAGVRLRKALEAAGFKPYAARVSLLDTQDVAYPAHLELAACLQLLLDSDQFHPLHPLDRTVCLGRVDEEGTIHALDAIAPLVIAARQTDSVRSVIVPAGCLTAAVRAARGEIDVYTCTDLRSVVDQLEGESPLPRVDSSHHAFSAYRGSPVDFSDVTGHDDAKATLELAAAAREPVLLIGPPGCGASMLAKRLPALLGDPTDEELDTIESVGALLGKTFRFARLFRAPHHTISPIGMFGLARKTGRVSPGEASLAHTGVLFLQDIHRFRGDVLDLLAVVLEDGVVELDGGYSLPAQPQLVAHVTPDAIDQIPDTLLAHFKLVERLDPVPYRELRGQPRGPGSAARRKRIEQALETAPVRSLSALRATLTRLPLS